MTYLAYAFEKGCDWTWFWPQQIFSGVFHHLVWTFGLEQALNQQHVYFDVA